MSESFTFQPGQKRSTHEFKPLEGIVSHYRNAMPKAFIRASTEIHTHTWQPTADPTRRTTFASKEDIRKIDDHIQMLENEAAVSRIQLAAWKTMRATIEVDEVWPKVQRRWGYRQPGTYGYY